MKKFTIFLFTFLPFLLCAQVETSLNIGSGFSFFGGSSASKYTVLDYRGNGIEESYGQTPGLSYHLSMEFKKVTTRNFLYGFGMSYDLSRSILKMNRFRDSFFDGRKLLYEDKIVFSMHNIGVQAFIGERIKKNNFDLEVRLNTEVLRPVFVYDKGDFTLPNNVEVEVNNRRYLNVFDFRIGPQINIYRKNTGLFISYSHGLTSYLKDININNIILIEQDVKSRQFRFGFSYRFSNK